MTGGERWRFLAVAVLAAAVLSRPGSVRGEWVFPGSDWTQKTPEELGVKTGKLDEFKNKVGGSGVVVKDGYLIYSWGSQTAMYDWFSASKPVLSTMLFCAINEGKVAGVDRRIADWGWPLSSADQTMTFRHLADMTSGYARAESPGQRWAYNDYAIQLYVDTLERVFQSSTLVSPGNTRVRNPLQFQDGSLFDTRGRVVCSVRDFARIGWFWMNRGNWNGSQLLPRSFFDNYMKADVPSTLPRSSASDSDYLGVGSYGGGSDQTGIGPGIYGFNWWFNTNRDNPSKLTWPSAPPDTFQANGRWGTDVMTMFPSLGMAVAADGAWGRFTVGDVNSEMNKSLRLLVEAVPEPSSLASLALGGLAMVRRPRARWAVCIGSPAPREAAGVVGGEKRRPWKHVGASATPGYNSGRLGYRALCGSLMGSCVWRHSRNVSDSSLPDRVRPPCRYCQAHRLYVLGQGARRT